MKAKEAGDLIPFDDVNEKYCISSFGDVVFAVEIKMKEVYTMASSKDPDQVEKVDLVYHDWKKTLSMLPEGTIVQKISRFYTLPHQKNMSDGCKTKRWNENMFEKRDVMFEKTYIVVSYQYKNQKGPKSKSTLLSRVERFEGIQYIEQYIQYFEAFVGSLKTSCDSVSELTGWETLDLFCEIWNQGSRGEFLEDVDIKRHGIAVGSKNVSVLTSRKLPMSFNGFTAQNRKIVESEKLGMNRTNYREDVSLPTSYLFPLGMGLPVDHTLVETIKIENREEVETRLDSEYKRLNFLVGLKSRDAVRKRETIDDVKDYKSTHEYRYASWGVTVLLTDSDEEKLSRLTNLVVDIGQKQLGMVLAAENYGSWNQFYAALPGCARLNKTLRLGFIEVYAYMTHLETFKSGNSKGIILVDLFGRPFVFDFWDELNKYCQSRNGVLFAPTGGGKSFLINHILDQCYWNGDLIFLIDVGGSYRRITALNNGVYIDSKNIENLQFNPFKDCFYQDGQYYPELDESGKKDALYLDFMASLICSCWYGTSGEDISKETYGGVRITINGYFKYVNELLKVGQSDVDVNFDSYYNYVIADYKESDGSYRKFIDIDSFIMLLRPYSTEGEYGFLLNAKESINIDNRWIAFDLFGILTSPRLTSPVLLIVMQMFQKIMDKWYGTNARMFIDEAVDFLQGGFFADYIGGLYRKIRKMGGQIFIITQSIDFLDKLDPLLRSSILGNSEIKLLLNHAKASASFEKLQKDLSLSNSEMELLRNQTAKEGSNYKIGFLKFGDMPGFLFRHEVSPETFSLYQTNAKDIQLIDDLIKSTGSIEGAVVSFVESKNEKND